MMTTGDDFLSLCRKERRTDTTKRYQPVFPMFDASLPKLPASWVWASFSELSERVSVGHVGPTSEFFSTKEEGVRFVRSQDVRPGRLMLETVAHVTRDFHSKLKKSQLKSGDVLVVRVGANRGDCCVVPNDVGEINCANIVFARPIFPNGFIGLFLRSDLGQSLLVSLTTGSAQGVLNTTSIAAIPVPVPPLRTQRKIAGVLLAYDELIENNTRRIAILEEMAQAIYREWFVNFRFPGHENAKLVDSPLGKIPEGWKSLRLGDLAQEVRRGVDPSQVDPDTPYVGLEHLPRRSITLGEWGKAKDVQSTKLAFRKGEILFGRIRPYFHKVGVAPIDGVCSTDAIVIVPNSPPVFGQVVCCVSSDDFVRHAMQTSQGTKMPRANWNVLVKYPLPLPPDNLLNEFNDTIANVVANLRLLMLKNRNLRATRDLLLPKLISGQLDVEELDIETGEPLVEAEA